jgi:hypothetical protein
MTQDPDVVIRNMKKMQHMGYLAQLQKRRKEYEMTKKKFCLKEGKSEIVRYYEKKGMIDQQTEKYLAQLEGVGEELMQWADCGWDYLREPYGDHTSKQKWYVWTRFERSDDIVMHSYAAKGIARIVETYYIDLEYKQESEYVLPCAIKGGNPLYKHLRSKKQKNGDKHIGFAQCDEDATKMLFAEALDLARLINCKLSEKDNKVLPIEYITKFIQCGIHCNDRDRFHTIEVLDGTPKNR